MKCDGCQTETTVGGLAKFGQVLLCADCLSLGDSASSVLMLAKEKEARESSETYERNYIAIEQSAPSLFRVTGYFANHKIAWQDNNFHTTRDKAQDHAEFLIKEFSMGGDRNPIPIVQLDLDRHVMVKVSKRWEPTEQKVTDRL